VEKRHYAKGTELVTTYPLYVASTFTKLFTGIAQQSRFSQPAEAEGAICYIANFTLLCILDFLATGSAAVTPFQSLCQA
jgi:hypothetical protein